MRPFVTLIGCAIFLATARTTCAAAGSSIADANYSQDDRALLDKSSTAVVREVGEQPHTIRYINRSRELKKNSGRRRKKGGNNSLSNAGGRANTRNNNGNKKNKKDNPAVEEDPSVIVSTTPIVEPDAATSSESGSTVSITTKNGGTVYEYEFTTPGGPMEEEEEEAVDTDSIVILEEDVVDILTTTTAAPSTASPSGSPTTSAPTASTASPTPVPSPGDLTVGPTTAAHASHPCGISSFRRRIALMLMVTEASGNIYDGTPQKAALDWLVDIDAYQACPDDPNALQRYTLAVFYYSTLGDEWLDCSATPTFEERTCDSVTVGTVGNDDSPKITGNYVWLSPVNECMWAGVQCMEATASIDRLEFEGNGLAGTLPSELGHLSELKYLYLEQGAIGGTIPTELGRLSKLLVLDLDYNYLTGEAIPSSLYNMWSLAQLDLNDNLLTGTINSAIGDFKNLKFLQIGRNPISGTIPESLGNLDLVIGGFENTLLTGTIPSSLCDNESSGQLVADCAGVDPRVECDCCTKCLETEQPALNQPALNITGGR